MIIQVQVDSGPKMALLGNYLFCSLQCWLNFQPSIIQIIKTVNKTSPIYTIPAWQCKQQKIVFS